MKPPTWWSKLLAAVRCDAEADTSTYGKCLPPYQNTIGGRHPSIWAGPLELNLHSHVDRYMRR